jgi:threonine dehydrogenase-like Zn-dependent dehydrogenase
VINSLASTPRSLMCRNGRYTERGIKELDGGASDVVFDAIANTAAYGIVCLTGVSQTGRTTAVDVGATNRGMVLENDAVIGSVNANLRHYTAAADALARADIDWLRRLITRRVPLERAAEAFHTDPGDIKTVVTLDGTPG